MVINEQTTTYITQYLYQEPNPSHFPFQHQNGGQIYRMCCVCGCNYRVRFVWIICHCTRWHTVNGGGEVVGKVRKVNRRLEFAAFVPWQFPRSHHRTPPEGNAREMECDWIKIHSPRSLVSSVQFDEKGWCHRNATTGAHYSHQAPRERAIVNFVAAFGAVRWWD